MTVEKKLTARVQAMQEKKLAKEAQQKEEKRRRAKKRNRDEARPETPPTPPTQQPGAHPSGEPTSGEPNPAAKRFKIQWGRESSQGESPTTKTRPNPEGDVALQWPFEEQAFKGLILQESDDMTTDIDLLLKRLSEMKAVPSGTIVDTTFYSTINAKFDGIKLDDKDIDDTELEELIHQAF
jgi:hypothetical protein